MPARPLVGAGRIYIYAPARPWVPLTVTHTLARPLRVAAYRQRRARFGYGKLPTVLPWASQNP